MARSVRTRSAYTERLEPAGIRREAAARAGHRQPELWRVRVHDGGVGFHQRAQERQAVTRVVGAEGLEAGQHRLERAVCQREDEVVFALEVEVERALADRGGLGHLLHGRVRGTAGAEDLLGGVEDRVSSLALVPGAAAGCGGLRHRGR